ncbi:ROK family protein [Kibdelosporangium persicum]|uniref:N-acetyl-D-glucosamine kinase n=1 Tax=Kibdelosporangium persicum TaxID=2698649 RepID=A0ABX2F4T8_9PSEU|nr:ROK family protein [Kibdelosporangium persicum]NRN66198.1 N-acetyl-D-glucosamine kinase [Kibdelosporangium persicum]
MSWLGVDIGGTKIQLVRCDDDLRVLDSRRAESPRGKILATAVELAAELAGDAKGIGIGAAGVIDPSGAVAATTEVFPGWEGTRLTDVVSRELGLPVVVDNDANAFLHGEATAGAARGYRHAFGITVGTGIGGAVISDGVLLRGASGGAGEIGHTPGFGDEPCTCGARGHLESIASGLSISRRYGQAVSAAVIADRARNGDEEARRVFAEAGAALGQAVAVVATVLDSQIAVLGGGVAGAWDLLEPTCRATVQATVLPTNADLVIETARLGAHAVAIGAAALAAQAS